MTGHEERRNVARKLRAAAAYLPYDIDSEDLEMAIATTVCNYDAPNVETLFNRLADLVEPEPERTCRVECYPPGYEDNLHYEVCSECGTILTASRPGDRHSKRANYCPSCGAKVVDE